MHEGEQHFMNEKMHIPTLIKYFALAWGVPILVVFVVRAFTPDPSQSRTNFSQREFRPARIWITEKKGTKNSDYFELRIRNSSGEEFFHRDPEREPIAELYKRFPKDAVIRILFSPGVEGNVLMEIAATNPSSSAVLSFESVMDEYASRRRVVYIVAAVWCGLANLIAFALWKVDVSDSTVCQNKPESVCNDA